MKKYFILFSSISLLFGCNSNTEKSASQFTDKTSYQRMANSKWLIGKWGNQSDEGNATEMWQVVNDSVYKAESCIVSTTGDTVFSEIITLHQNGENVYYTVKDKKGGSPVTFTLTSATDSILVFENPEHDFPTKISYSLVNKDSIFAQISGTVNGQANSIPFPFKKVK